MSMNVELKAKWVEALRSGNYKQGTGYLRDSRDLYCCLGVLCDIMDNSQWKLVKIPGTGPDYYSYKNLSGNLTENTLEKIGMARRTEATLTVMNDDNGFDFNTIANYIEENL